MCHKTLYLKVIRKVLYLLLHFSNTKETNSLTETTILCAVCKNFVENTASKPIYVGSVKLEITATPFRTEEKLLSFFGKD